MSADSLLADFNYHLDNSPFSGDNSKLMMNAVSKAVDSEVSRNYPKMSKSDIQSMKDRGLNSYGNLVRDGDEFTYDSDGFSSDKFKDTYRNMIIQKSAQSNSYNDLQYQIEELKSEIYRLKQ